MRLARRFTLVCVYLLAIVAVGLVTTATARENSLSPQGYFPVVARPAAAPAPTGTPPPTVTPGWTETRFTGTALERFDAPCCDQLSWWRVQVDAVQAGSAQCRDQVVKVLFGSGFLVRLGFVDPSIQPGDRVEVYGYHVQSGEGCSADLIEARHYIRRAAHLAVDPPRPRAADPISLTVSGQWGSSCPAVIHSFARVRGNVFQLVAGLTDAAAACNTVVTSWRYSEVVGQLPAGHYVVLVEVVDLGGGAFAFRERLEFDVAP